MGKATATSQNGTSKNGNSLDVNGFQFFEGATSENASEPRITIRKNGLLVLTRAAVEMLGHDATHVRLGIDPKTNSVGLQAVSAGTQGGYLLRSPKKGMSKIANGKRFFAHLGLSLDRSQSFDAESFGDGIVGFRLPVNS